MLEVFFYVSLMHQIRTCLSHLDFLWYVDSSAVEDVSCSMFIRRFGQLEFLSRFAKSNGITTLHHAAQEYANILLNRIAGCANFHHFLIRTIVIVRVIINEVYLEILSTVVSNH